MINQQNIRSLSEKKKNNTKTTVYSADLVRYVLLSVLSSVRISIPSNSGPLFLLMMERQKTRVDVATLPLVDFYSC